MERTGYARNRAFIAPMRCRLSTARSAKIRSFLRANTIVVPGHRMELAMQLIFTPFVARMMERRQRAGGRS